MKNNRFLIASGGTGGHFYPGFALGKALHEQGADVLFVVRKADPAANVLATHGLPYTELNLHTGLPRSINPVRHLRFIKQLFTSLTQARALIKQFRPDVTLGMGGYVSFPLIFCSHFMGVKTAVHESNSIWGLSNKICGWFSTVRLMGLPMKRTFKNAVLVSTPIRQEFSQKVDRAQVLGILGLDPQKTTLLITGGSQGAKGLNEALPAIIRALSQYQFVHLTGQRWYEEQCKAYQGITNVKTLAYCEDIYRLMKSCDGIICRSGASTLAEIIACKIPAILVPFPHAAANHQYFNAKTLVDAGCAEIVLQNSKLARGLEEKIAGLTPQKLAMMRKQFDKLDLPSPLQATQVIASLLKELS